MTPSPLILSLTEGGGWRGVEMEDRERSNVAENLRLYNPLGLVWINTSRWMETEIVEVFAPRALQKCLILIFQFFFLFMNEIDSPTKFQNL